MCDLAVVLLSAIVLVAMLTLENTEALSLQSSFGSHGLKCC